MGVGGGLRAKYMLPRFRIRDSIQFGLQSDHVLEKLNFDLLTPGSGDGGERDSAGKIFATMLLHSCFPYCDMQHDHVRKKLIFDVLTPPTKSTQGVWHRPLIKTKIAFDIFLFYCNSVCMRNFRKK